VHDVLEFGMAGHGRRLGSLKGKCEARRIARRDRLVTRQSVMG
jgi:hypothetical protein